MNKSIVFFIVFFIPQILLAQWEGEAEIGFSYFSGNINIIDLRSEGRIVHEDSVFEYTSFYKAIYAEAENIQSNEELSGGVKFDYLPNSKFSPFIVLSAYRNDFKNIHLRLSGVIGGKLLVYKSEKANYSISMAYQFDAEDYLEETEDENKMRLSIRPKIKQQIGESIYFEHISFFKPNLRDFQDYTVLSSTSITNKITKKIHLKISYEYEYVNEPTKADLLQTDQVLMASVKIEF
ncbi:MAG: DUF481 domain-containing protein, partial [Bacteroidales bacterium]|nr:DUF481 domain-containing protein [Bacteroidales bacterium]